jgi:hypothetical protein
VGQRGDFIRQPGQFSPCDDYAKTVDLAGLGRVHQQLVRDSLVGGERRVEIAGCYLQAGP